jgi:HK97 family phage portal protein
MLATLLAAIGNGTDTGDRSPWGDFWFKPVPGKVGMQNITPDTALQLTAVLACVRILAEGRAMLPFQLMRRREDRGFDEVADHWLYRLFAVRPNRFQDPFLFAEMMQAHLALRGNAYAEIVGSTLDDIELVPMHPDTITIDVLADGSWRYKQSMLDGSIRTLTRAQVFHLRGISLDGIRGISPIAAARESLAVGMAAQSYGARFFDNDAKPGGWIEYPGQFADEEKRDSFRKSWQKAQAGMNRGKTAVLEFGMKYHELGVTNDEAQFLETRKFQVTEIARLFRVPPHMIADLDRATFSNIEQQSIEYVRDSLQPWLRRWAEAIRYTFLDPDDPADADLVVRFPVRELLRGDLAARAQFYSRGILDGWLTRNEARLDDDRNPLDNLDEPLRPLNMGDVSKTAPAKPDRRRGDPPAALDTPQRAVRAEALIAAAVNAVIAEEQAQAFDDVAEHAAFVADLLAVPEAEARRYAEWRAQEGADGIEMPALTALAMKGKWQA